MYDAFIIILIVVGLLLIMITPATSLYFRYLKATIKPNRPRGSAYTAREMQEKTLRNRAITERENSTSVLRLMHRTMTFGILSALIAFLLILLNNHALESNAVPIDVWKLTHETGINWVRWIILVLIIVLFLLIIGCLIYGLVTAVAEALPAISIPSSGLNLIPSFSRASTGSKKTQKKEVEKNPKLLRYLKVRQNILRSNGELTSHKSIALKEIKDFLDYDLSSNPNKKYEQFHLLDNNIQNALKDLSSDMKMGKVPKNNGRWTGEICNSVWIPDDDYTPPNKSYSNVHGLTWREIKRKHGFSGLRCDHGRFRFDEIAWYKVRLPNFTELITSSDREALHEAAFDELARQLGKTVDEVKAIKESANDHTPMGQKNLAWHEDIDCETLYLVPQEIHGNIIHFGGVAMCQLLRKHRLI